MGKSKAKQAATVERAAVDTKRAKAYADMEPHLRDCQRWAHLVDTLATDDDPAILALVAEHAANEIDKLVEVYYALDFAP
jgi:hypothetical protein